MAKAQIGYAAMLEQFAPTELVELCEVAEANGFSGRDGRRPRPAVGAAAGPGRLRLVIHGRRRRAHSRRHRARRDVPLIPPAPRDHRPGGGDDGGHVSRPLLARAGLGRGAQRARHCRLLARGARADRAHVRGDRDHAQAVHRQGRQAPGRVLQDGDDAAVDDARRAATDLRRHRRHDHGREDRAGCATA